MNNNLNLRTAVLYPDRMRINGDYGNLLVFSNRCRWRGISVETHTLLPGDTMPADFFDILLFGGGQDRRQQTFVADDMIKSKAGGIRQAVEGGMVVLATGGGYQMSGRFFATGENARIPGLGLLDMWTVDSEDQISGDIIIDTDFLKPRTMVGFESHSGKTYLGGADMPLGRRVIGQGNNGEDAFEGCRSRTVFGTYLHGPILPRNPHFTDHLIHLALDRRYGDIPLAPLDDSLEWEAHQSVLVQSGRGDDAIDGLTRRFL